ncbi:MAG: type I polyketide synthase, partial [Acidobacteriota bacterium]|nr:type I polyketide synthase [Acidobacteriota bacterium]
VPALVPNIAAGRIANRLDLMGPSYTIDAACASSLIAVDTAVQELRAGRCDMALVGGMHVALPMLLRQVFCQLEALSPLQKIRPFDKSADGTILGEGIGMAVLERRSDAERAGRRTYALIKGVGTASDGQGMSVMAPRLDGEILALRRAYEGSGVSPDSVGLIEAHGTGTPVGDATEIEALTAVFGERSSRFPRCAVGTVKSMIGHLMPAAGMAALIKTALALHHKVLPQTLNVTEPLEAFESGTTPFYVNGTTRPWIRGREAGPRRAGINAFGFGGINAHVILEEHDGDVSGQHRPARWESEAVVLSAASRNALAGRGRELLRSIETHPQMRLRDLAFTLNRAAGEGPFTLALVATSPGDLAEKLEGALEKIADPGCRRIKNVRRGIYFFEEQLGRSGKLAFLFPGEGSQYRGMLADLCTAFPEVRPRFEITESGFARAGISESPSDYIFPPSNCSDEQRAASDAWLSHMRGAVAAVLTSDYAVLTLLRELQIRPDALVGHSTGEFAALVASGIVDIEDDGRAETYAGELHEVFQTLEQSDLELPPAMLVAIGGDSATVLEILGESGGAIQIAMDNCPHQSVIVGDPEIVREAVKKLQKRGLICETLPFDRPYHTPQFAPLARTVREFLDRWVAGPPRVETYTCATKAPFPEDREEILDLAAEQWVRPVAFRETVEAMYDDGVRLFVEVGARGNLTAFVDDILRGRTHAAVAADLETRSGISQLNHLVATLAAHGVPMNLGALYEGRGAQAIDLESSDDPSSKPGVSATRLETGWPVMRLSDETLARIREKTGRRREREAVMRQPAQHATGPTGAPAAVDSGAPAAGSTVTRQGVVAAHLRSMERFLQLNQDVMQSYLGRGGSAPAASAGRAPAAVATPTPAIANLPLAGRLVSHEPGREAVVRRDLDPDLDLFLRDHTFGRRVSRTDPDLLGVTVMPLTVSMEMMAEVASHVTGGGTLIGMKDVRGLRWIAAEGGRIPLEIVARRLEEAGPGEVRVQIFEAERPGAEPRGFSVPLI